MIAPAAVPHDRRSPIPGTLARPLSELIAAQQRRKGGGLRQRNAMLTCPFPLVEGGEA